MPWLVARGYVSSAATCLHCRELFQKLILDITFWLGCTLMNACMYLCQSTRTAHYETRLPGDSCVGSDAPHDCSLASHTRLKSPVHWLQPHATPSAAHWCRRDATQQLACTAGTPVQSADTGLMPSKGFRGLTGLAKLAYISFSTQQLSLFLP